MFFKELPDNIKKAIKELTKDQVFQARFSEDKKLDDLDAEKYDPTKVYPDFLSFLGHRRVFGKSSLRPITPIVWCFLWCLDNPIVINDSKREPTQADIDLFFYLLENGVQDIPLVDIVTNAAGYCERMGMSEEVIANALSILVSEAFAPLKMFPATNDRLVGEDILPFDADWMSGMISKVHEVTGYTPDFIMNKMSMTGVCYYFVQYARMQGTKGIERRTPQEIMEAQDHRASELICDYLIEKGIMTHDERDDILTKMTTPPENDK